MHASLRTAALASTLATMLAAACASFGSSSDGDGDGDGDGGGMPTASDDAAPPPNPVCDASFCDFFERDAAVSADWTLLSTQVQGGGHLGIDTTHAESPTRSLLVSIDPTDDATTSEAFLVHPLSGLTSIVVSTSIWVDELPSAPLHAFNLHRTPEDTLYFQLGTGDDLLHAEAPSGRPGYQSAAISKIGLQQFVRVTFTVDLAARTARLDVGDKTASLSLDALDAGAVIDELKIGATFAAPQAGEAKIWFDDVVIQ